MGIKKVSKSPVWTDEECLAYIQKRVRFHVEAQESEKIPMCTAKERWASDDVFSVMSDTQKHSVRNFYNYKQAKDFIDSGEKNLVNPRIEYRLSSSLKCEQYCMVSEFCDQKKRRDELIAKAKPAGMRKV